MFYKTNVISVHTIQHIETSVSATNAIAKCVTLEYEVENRKQKKKCCAYLDTFTSLANGMT